MFFETKQEGEIKDVDGASRIVSGYLSKFGNVDSDNDIIQKGAFSKSIRERKNDIYFLYQHDWKKPLGKFQELKEDDYGLYFEASISKTSYGNDLIELYKDGVVKEHSIGFNTIKSLQDQKSGVRTITEVKLWEGSAVTLGANSDTPFTGFKSSIKEIQDQSKLLIKALKNGNYTDETFVLLEIALKQLQQEAYNLGQKNTKENEPPPSTREILEPLESIFNNFKL